MSAYSLQSFTRRVMGGCLFLAAILLSDWAAAHPLAPAMLHLQEKSEPDHFQVTWRRYAVQPMKAKLVPVLPDTCQPLAPVQWLPEESSKVTGQWVVDCSPTGLANQTVAISGLEQLLINVILRVSWSKGGEHHVLLDADKTAVVIPAVAEDARGTLGEVLIEYFSFGGWHLLQGPDHLLFLLGLMLLLVGWRRRVIAITAFTIGHSLTLGLAATGLISFPQMLMELLIALTLLCVAREVLSKSEGWISRSPGWVAGGFGLIHGCGFASVLGELGLPSHHLLPALFAFNLGIEFAQIAVLLAATVIVGLALKLRLLAQQLSSDWMRGSAAYGMGGLAALWCVERLINIVMI